MALVTNEKHYQAMQARIQPNHIQLLQQKMSGYVFHLKNFEQDIYGHLYFQVLNPTTAFRVLEEFGLLYPHELNMTRKKYFETYQEKKISALPYGYRMALYFLIDNHLAEVTL